MLFFLGPENSMWPMKHPVSCFRKAHFLLKRNQFKNQRNKYKHKAKHPGVYVGHSLKMSCHLNMPPVFNGASLRSNHIQTLLGCMLWYAFKKFILDITKLKSSHKLAAEAQKEEAFGDQFYLVMLTYKVISDLLLTCAHSCLCFFSLLSSEWSLDMIDHLGLSSLFSLSYNQKPVLGNETNSSIVMKGWYKTFFPNISNDAFSCSDHFSFVKGHNKLYVHIKQRYISLGEYIRITVLWLFSPDVWTFAHEAFAMFFIVDIQMELNQEFLVRRRKKTKPM